MPWTELALPWVLLITKFLLKLFIDRTPTLPDFISSVLALPVDIVFLSASLLAAYVISSPSNTKEDVALFFYFFCIAIVNVFVWRRSEKQFVKDKQLSASLLGIFNVAVSFMTLLYSLSLLSVGGVK